MNRSAPFEIVDIVLTHDLRAIETTTVSIEGARVHLATIESLAAMKEPCGLPQDLEDARALRAIAARRENA